MSKYACILLVLQDMPVKSLQISQPFLMTPCHVSVNIFTAASGTSAFFASMHLQGSSGPSCLKFQCSGLDLTTQLNLQQSTIHHYPVILLAALYHKSLIYQRCCWKCKPIVSDHAQYGVLLRLADSGVWVST